jgi:hypothetical protein
MSRRHIPAKVLFGAALAGFGGVVWAEARKLAPADAEPDGVSSGAELAQPKPTVNVDRGSRRRRTVAKVGAGLGVVSLMIAGMGLSAAPSGGLEEPARQATPHGAKRLGELSAANRHFYDVPAHITLPSRTPILPAPRPNERTMALARYADVLGSGGVQAALESQRTALSQRVLADSRVHIYPGGRSDLEYGRVDPRVVAMIEYLADTYGEVTVSCLISGHSHFVHQSAAEKKRKAPRRVSAHVYGRAADISAVAGIPIAGHQEPGGITEQAIRAMLALPGWLHPKQVISLLDLGGPSFPLPDHADHIHVGY